MTKECNNCTYSKPVTGLIEVPGYPDELFEIIKSYNCHRYPASFLGWPKARGLCGEYKQEEKENE